MHKHMAAKPTTQIKINRSYLPHVLRIWSDVLLQNEELVPDPASLGPMVRILLAVGRFGLVVGESGSNGTGWGGRPVAPLDHAQAQQQRAKTGRAAGCSHVKELLLRRQLTQRSPTVGGFRLRSDQFASPGRWPWLKSFCRWDWTGNTHILDGAQDMSIQWGDGIHRRLTWGDGRSPRNICVKEEDRLYFHEDETKPSQTVRLISHQILDSFFLWRSEIENWLVSFLNAFILIKAHHNLAVCHSEKHLIHFRWNICSCIIAGIMTGGAGLLGNESSAWQVDPNGWTAFWRSMVCNACPWFLEK